MIADSLRRDYPIRMVLVKLVTNVTELKVAGAKAYLSPIMDLHNNGIVAWSVTRSLGFAQTM